MFDLDDITAQADNLEPLSASASRLMSIFAQDDWEPEEVIEVVQLDQALSGKVLRLANSAMLGSREPISTLDAAVMRLGKGAVLSTAVACSMRPNLDSELPQYELGDGAIWRHSVAASLFGDRLHKSTRGRIPQEVMTAALMHDIGKLLIARNLDHDDTNLLERARHEGHLDWSRAEREILMVNHGDLGGLIAQHWKLPDSIVQAILFHHDPEEMPGPDETRVLAYAVQLCDVGAHRCTGEESFGEHLLADTLDALELSRDDFDELVELAGESLDDVIGCYS